MKAPWIDTTHPLRLEADPASGCSHAGQAYEAVPGTQGCAECLAMGSDWVHLRLCMECGHVGCCDQSPNRHATAHYHATHHPVIRSIQPGEAWGWCYRDGVFWGD